MKKLSKDEMKKAVGGVNSTPDCYDDACNGGGSCWHDVYWNSWQCGLTQSEAKDKQTSQGGLWCSESCCTSCIGSHHDLT